MDNQKVIDLLEDVESVLESLCFIDVVTDPECFAAVEVLFEKVADSLYLLKRDEALKEKSISFSEWMKK